MIVPTTEPADFSVTVGRHGDTVVLALAGELDAGGAPRLVEHLGAATEGGASEIVIDLRALTFMDSSGIAVLMTAHRHATEGRWALTILKGAPHVQRVLELCGLTGVLPMVSAPGP